MRKLVLLVGCLCLIGGTLPSGAESAEDNTPSYIPEVHGTIRGKYEYQPQMSAGRFEVRNARFSLTGKVSETVSYKAEIDLSDEGSLRMLDAYGRYRLWQQNQFTIGQMRVPFSIDAPRSPHQQYFANRSFIAKQVGNVRDVGATLHYQSEAPFPWSIDGGLFNGSGLTNQKDFWADRLNYAAKLQLHFISPLNLTLSTMTLQPEAVHIQLYDAGLTFTQGRWMAEAEVLYKHYANHAFPTVRAFDGFLCYSHPLRKTFQKISLLARYDRMTNHSNGTAGDDGKLYLTDAARQRLTTGITLSFLKPFVADIRINYEQYFYASGVSVKVSEQNKLVLEFMTRF